jgi:hypothetical protein
VGFNSAVELLITETANRMAALGDFPISEQLVELSDRIVLEHRQERNNTIACPLQQRKRLQGQQL